MGDSSARELFNLFEEVYSIRATNKRNHGTRDVKNYQKVITSNLTMIVADLVSVVVVALRF